MSYREFTFEDVKQKLGLHIEEYESLHDGVEDVTPSPTLTAWLDQYAPLAIGINTEKARSEMIIAPVLLSVWHLFPRQIGFFSGREFNVDPARGLNGVCDYLLSLSPELYVVTAPLFVVTEAKNENIPAGLPQCLAEMVAAQEFNRVKGIPLPAVHGVVTTGNIWRFLRLSNTEAWIDRREYYLHDLERILGILCHIVREARAALPA